MVVTLVAPRDGGLPTTSLPCGATAPSRPGVTTRYVPPTRAPLSIACVVGHHDVHRAALWNKQTSSGTFDGGSELQFPVDHRCEGGGSAQQRHSFARGAPHGHDNDGEVRQCRRIGVDCVPAAEPAERWARSVSKSNGVRVACGGCHNRKKGIRVIVTLECTEARKEGATPSRYTTEKVRTQLSTHASCV